MFSFRAVVGLTTLVVAAGCNFAPSGGASEGGDGSGSDGGPPGDIDSGSGGIGGDQADAGDAALDLCAPTSGLVACYPFEANLEDASGEKNDLRGAGYSFDPGNRGSALSLDDASQMDAIDDSSLDFTGALTIEAWVEPGEAQERWFVDHDNRWGLEIAEDGALTCTVRVDGEEEGGEGIEVSGGNAAPGAWTHVACTYNGSQVALYVEGAEVAVTGADGPIYTGDGSGFTVGRDAPEGDSFVGLIDTVRIWSIARTAPQIACSAAGDC